MPTRNKDKAFFYEGFSTPTGTIVPDDVFDILAPRLSEAELRVLLYIVRRTFGFKKEGDSISLTQMARGIRTTDGRVLDSGTGMSRSAVWRGVNGLLQKGIVLANRQKTPQGDSQVNYYTLHFKKTQSPHSQLKRHNQTSLHGRVVLQKNHPSSPKELPVGAQKNPQETVLQETVKQHIVIVNNLTQFGLSPATAKRIATQYEYDYIAAKLDLAHWLVDIASPLIQENPAGYLRRAIEEDYTPPKSYRPRAERDAEANKLAEQAETIHRMEEEALAQRQALVKRTRQEHESVMVSGGQLNTITAWERVLTNLETQMSRSNYNTWLRDSMLLGVKENTAVVGVLTDFQREYLETNQKSLVTNAVREVLGDNVGVRFHVLSRR